MLHSYFCFSIERTLLEKLFFVIVFSSTNQSNLNLKKIPFEIDFPWDQSDSAGLDLLWESNNIFWFEEKGSVSGGILSKRYTSFSVGGDMPSNNYWGIMLETDIWTF